MASAVESVTEAMEEERGTKERPTRALEGSNTMDDYVILRPVGEGSFGKVFQARQRYTGRACAMKFIPKHGKNERELESLRSEIDIMKTLDHPNVIKMLDAFETKKEIVVVMEFAQGVLYDVLEHDARLREKEVRMLRRKDPPSSPFSAIPYADTREASCRENTWRWRAGTLGVLSTLGVL